MTIAEESLKRSRLFRRIKKSTHGQLVEPYAASLVEAGLSRPGTWRSLNVVGELLDWMARRRTKLISLDERMTERYLRHQAAKKCIQLGDRAALKRWLSTLRAAGTIAHAVEPRRAGTRRLPPRRTGLPPNGGGHGGTPGRAGGCAFGALTGCLQAPGAWTKARASFVLSFTLCLPISRAPSCDRRCCLRAHRRRRSRAPRKENIKG
jgi:hypothetical protein